MVAWGPLFRRVARLLAPLLLRHLRRGGWRRRPGGAAGGTDPSGTVIDVDTVGALDRFDDATRRAVVAGAEAAGGVGFTAAALLVGLVETWPELALALEEGGTGRAGLRSSLSGRLAADADAGPAEDARRALEQAEARADRRRRFVVGRHELLGGLLDPAVGLASHLDATTLDVMVQM